MIVTNIQIKLHAIFFLSIHCPFRDGIFGFIADYLGRNWRNVYDPCLLDLGDVTFYVGYLAMLLMFVIILGDYVRFGEEEGPFF